MDFNAAVYWISNFLLEAPNTVADNSSGFTGIPAGIRNWLGVYLSDGILAHFWSSNPYGAMYEDKSWGRGLQSNESGMVRMEGTRVIGSSIRCIKD